ncbi:MAG: lipopolysaccharide biosynthesis protein [Armatimonadetes bacterium]|nr:lipopolysaccharide biosynthesis protein [Armatimonadota bacterium]
MEESPDQHRPQRKHYLWTYASILLVTVCGVLVYRFASKILGEDGFPEYALGRRTISLIHPLIAQGLGYAVAREVARVLRGSDRSEGSYLLASILAMFAMCGLVLIPANLWPGAVAFLFFGDSRFQFLVPALSGMLLGLSLHSVSYSFFQGRMHLGIASILGALNLGLVPILVFVLVGGSAVQVFAWTAALVAAISTFALLIGARGLVRAQDLRWRALRSHGKQLLAYGLPRAPGALALSALLGLPATLAAHLQGLEAGGMVAFGGTLLTLAGAAVSPLSVILLPQSSKMLKLGARDELRSHAWRLFQVIFLLMTAGVCVGTLAVKPFVAWYLGAGFSDQAEVLLWMLPAALPYSLYCCFRSIVDGAYRRAVNANNTYVALAVLLAVTAGASWAGTPFPVLIGLLAGMYTLGGLTLRSTAQIFRQQLEEEER